VARPRGKRVLSEEERTLWAHVTRHVKPLVESSIDSPEHGEGATTDAAAFLTAESGPQSSPPRRHPDPSPPRTKSGKQPRPRRDVTTQARLDLHGMTEDEAHRALVQFIAMSSALRCRRVLIITGKGKAADPKVKAHPNEGRGILRRLVPLWLEAESLRHFVAGVMSAPVELGGPGAIVVDLNPRAK
jgi:DNA-nicking Smr family endonuclease